jgi:hypothetical protein
MDTSQTEPAHVAHSTLVGGPKGRRRVRPKRHISGRVVHVRLGFASALLAALLAIALLVAAIALPPSWADLALLVVLAPLALFGGYAGVWGVIRYGLFTEGCGAAVIAAELRLGRLSRWAGILAQFAIVVALAAVVVIVVRLIV